MSLPASDRALRRLVADLAAAAPQDIDEVLDGLTSAQQQRVRALLEAYDGPNTSEPPPAAATASRPPPFSTADLSSWLAARAAPDVPVPRPFRSALDEAAQGFAMTPRSLSALAAAAGAVLPPHDLVEPPAPAPKASWWRRLAPGRRRSGAVLR